MLVCLHLIIFLLLLDILLLNLFNFHFFYSFLVCSLCIRRSLNVHQKCPVCEKETGMTNLRSVWILDDLAKRFQKCRTWLLEESIRKVKEITEVTKINPADDPSSLFNLDQIKTCPYCKWDFDLDSIKIHMNQCKSLTSTNKNKGDGERDGGDGGKSTILHQHLAKPIYHMLKDSQIKKKLAELDLPTDGDRNKLIWRHSEYVSMWNAKMIDTRIPSKESDIKLELMKLEKNFFSSSSKKDHQQHHNHHATNSITISNPEEYSK